ncbi:MAG: iron-binding protein hemerythrin [Caloramator sp.]|jgi:hemerythrin|uniref:bacteriohemerythrin n=1 Tax=Caloramator sp. TaxID=1871330 RepID=UPI001DBC1CAC|nr:bacteriohemerythrin [Caloramator sp.]MBZ4662694.1 iron-binding protein hemerythrin [Caloramator sp.]
MITWKKEYSMGVEHIDNQHKHLVEIANKAYEVLKNDLYIDKFDKIVEILKELEDYTVYHFDSEEEYMKQIGHEGYFLHKIEHKQFIDKIKSIDLNKVDIEQDKYLLDILNFIVDWLVKHILEKDKEIVK